MKVTVIGMGLIGGSIAMECKSKGYDVVGVESNSYHANQALDLGLVDSIEGLDEALIGADLVGLCIPVGSIRDLISRVLDKITTEQTVFDVGSNKENICKAVAEHPKRNRFVAAHPLAGTEFSGPNAALRDLFFGKRNIICERKLSAPDALKSVTGLFADMGMENLFMPASDHDKHMAYVSHLSHVTSFTLGLTVLDIEKDEKQIFNLASTGLESTVRLAKSSPVTWGSIFTDNADYLSEALEKYIDYITAFKKAIDDRDLLEITRMMESANEMRRVLDGI